MTGSVNGIGTGLCGDRPITDDELNKWSQHLPIQPYKPHPQFHIATEAFIVLFIPIIPLRTYVLFYEKQGAMNSEYRICYFPGGKEKVYWAHVKESWSFYIAPILLAIILFWIYVPPLFS